MSVRRTLFILIGCKYDLKAATQEQRDGFIVESEFQWDFHHTSDKVFTVPDWMGGRYYFIGVVKTCTRLWEWDPFPETEIANVYELTDECRDAIWKFQRDNGLNEKEPTVWIFIHHE